MEASTLTTAAHSGLLARRSPLLRLQSDVRLVALIRDGHDRAFEVLFDRYQGRLLAFCRNLLHSQQDAEDVLQEVFVAAHTAMLADERAITARPWLYRIARNRCLNHLRRQVPEGQDSMDIHPYENGTTTLERVQKREEIREIVADMHELPETQRTAMVLREIDDLSYTEIAQAMGTTLPAVKSLLVRGRMALAEAGEARLLTCGDVRLELAEAAEGLSKASGPARRHVRDCPSCRRYRRELRSSTKAVAGLAPFGLFALFQKLIGIKLGGGAAGGGAAASAGGGATAAGGGAAAGAGGAAAAAGGSGAVGSAIAAGGAAGGTLGAKAAVGMATAALFTAGAVGVNKLENTDNQGGSARVAQGQPAHASNAQRLSAPHHGAAHHATLDRVHAAPAGQARAPGNAAGRSGGTEAPPREQTAPPEEPPTTPTTTTGQAPPPTSGSGSTGNASGSSNGGADPTPPPPDPTPPPPDPTDPPPPTTPPTPPTVPDQPPPAPPAG